MVPWNDIKDRVEEFTKMPMEKKKALEGGTQLFNVPAGELTIGEQDAKLLEDTGAIDGIQFLYEE